MAPTVPAPVAPSGTHGPADELELKEKLEEDADEVAPPEAVPSLPPPPLPPPPHAANRRLTKTGHNRRGQDRRRRAPEDCVVGISDLSVGGRLLCPVNLYGKCALWGKTALARQTSVKKSWIDVFLHRFTLTLNVTFTTNRGNRGYFCALSTPFNTFYFCGETFNQTLRTICAAGHDDYNPAHHKQHFEPAWQLAEACILFP